MNAPKYVLPKDNAELNKIQDQAIRAANSARNKIQLALVATVHHLAQHHDVRVARRLVDGLHDTVRGKALVEFLTKFGHVIVTEVTEEVDGKKKTVTTFSRIKGTAEEHSIAIRKTWEECKATMWWDLKKENPYKGFSLEDALKRVIREATLAQEKALNGADNVSLDNVSDATIKQVLALCKFDAIIDPANDAGNEGGVKAA